MTTSPSTNPSSSSSPLESWDELRREARRLEGEAEARIASLARSSTSSHSSSDESELQRVLERLESVISTMERSLPPNEPSKTHTLSHHKGALQDLKRELGRARSTRRDHSPSERDELLGHQSSRRSSSRRDSQLPTSTAPSIASATDGDAARLTREQSRLESASGTMEGVIDAASSTLSALTQQRATIERASSSGSSIGARLPGLRSVMSQIRQKRNKDTIVLACVIASCTLFLIIYIMSKHHYNRR